MTDKSKMKYEDALHQLEEISQKMENGEYEIDELTVQLKKALELVKLCKDKLQKIDKEVQKML